MDVSVVIPLYNKARYVARALDSVLAQTRPPSQIVVVDDGSTDGGADIVQRYSDSRVSLLRQENQGVSAARNRGIDEVRSELIGFLDADDEWKPCFLETILELAKQFPGCGAYATAYDIVEADGRRCGSSDRVSDSTWQGLVSGYFRIPRRYPLCSSAIAVPKHVFDTVGTFPVGCPRGEDLDMWCRIALQYSIAFSDIPGAVFHQEAERRSAERHPILPNWRDFPVVVTIDEALRAGCLRPGIDRADLEEYRNRELLRIARDHLSAGDYTSAREHLRKAASTRRLRGEWLRACVRAYAPSHVRRLVRAARRML
jgi:glycosyltransferase involved in cell wall biosynthesis